MSSLDPRPTISAASAVSAVSPAPIPPAAGAPPPPPRPLTPASLRRGWVEPDVRVWWLCALLLGVAVLYFSIAQFWNWWSESRLLRLGTVVNAIILGPEVQSVKHSPVEADQAVYLRFTFKGVEYTVHGFLPPLPPKLQGLEQHEQWYVTQESIPIHIDPDNPQKWTAVNAIKPLYTEVFLAMFLAPMVGLLWLGALLRRRSVLKLWREGEAAEAVVLETRQFPTAPMSRLVRCALREYGREHQLYHVVLPTRAARLNPRDHLWLILPRATGARALAAILYV